MMLLMFSLLVFLTTLITGMNQRTFLEKDSLHKTVWLFNINIVLTVDLAEVSIGVVSLLSAFIDK